jgi:hypothetical protein
MTTTGTSTFNLNLNDLVEEAFERCGAELRTGYDLKTARRSLNLLTIEWANRGINLWTIDQGSIAMVQGQIVYDLPVDTIDLLEQVIRTNPGTSSNQLDININRISVIPTSQSQTRMLKGVLSKCGSTGSQARLNRLLALLTRRLTCGLPQTKATITPSSTTACAVCRTQVMVLTRKIYHSAFSLVW